MLQTKHWFLSNLTHRADLPTGQHINVTCRYMPVLPLVLVNGAEGIGTGWSTTIPNYNPRDVVANLKALLDGQPMTPMQPWYKVRAHRAAD